MRASPAIRRADSMRHTAAMVRWMSEDVTAPDQSTICGRRKSRPARAHSPAGARAADPRHAYLGACWASIIVSGAFGLLGQLG